MLGTWPDASRGMPFWGSNQKQPLCGAHLVDCALQQVHGSLTPYVSNERHFYEGTGGVQPILGQHPVARVACS